MIWIALQQGRAIFVRCYKIVFFIRQGNWRTASNNMREYADY